LFGRVTAVVLSGLVAAWALSYGSVMRERHLLSDTMMLPYVESDIASSVALFDRLPPQERHAWLSRLSRPHLRWTLDAPFVQGPVAGAWTRQLQASLVDKLGEDRVQAAAVRADDTVLLHLRLADGSPLKLELRPPHRRVSAETALLLLLQIALVGAAVWWGVRQATQPLARLAEAAVRLGQDPHTAPLSEEGPSELRSAAAAFNAMQRRIAAHMAERLHILAAVSHDLQTPITRMRVRTELLPDGEARARLQADLAEMQGLIDEGLAYARTSHAAAEKRQPVDLQALLDTLVCDYADAGRNVKLHAPEPLVAQTRAQALRRIVANLIDNALKFAGDAELTLSRAGTDVQITVRDRGPGIPEEHMIEVLQPFRRLDASRSRHTGGSGLGLAIADQLSGALGAQLRLSNREGGGLEAKLLIPLS
jgi:signal transduction histidine kinase